MTEMTSIDIVTRLVKEYPHLVPTVSWGETSLFYNPDHALTKGVYFATIKDHDGAHDRGSDLDRDGVYRVSFGLPPAAYEPLFGPRPERPRKGEVVATGHDFTAVNTLMPHPVYGWMGWVQVVCPTAATMRELAPLITQAYEKAQRIFERRIRQTSES